MHLIIHLFVWQIFIELLLCSGSHYVTAPNGSCIDPAWRRSQSCRGLSYEEWLKELGAQVVGRAWQYLKSWIREFIQPSQCQRVKIGKEFSDDKNRPRGLRWWRSGWESACQCRGHGIDPWSGKIPHAVEQLSPCAATTEACRPRACAPQQEKPLQWEGSTPQRRVGSARCQLKKARAQQRRPNTAKNK